MKPTSALAHTEWDAIVIGTGVGGSTFGHALAKAGKRVLFCERGRNETADDETAIRGVYPEEHPGDSLAELLARGGRWHEEIIDESGPRTRRFVPFLGTGAGGSSALYGMALERFAPEDFSPRLNHPAETESSLEATWPVSYADFRPYYEAAERLYRVRGGGDLPKLTPGSAELFEHFTARGLHPYRLPQACEFVKGCEGCQSFLCKRECKNDSARMCLTPSVREHGSMLIDSCTVVRLVTQSARVTGVECRVGDEALTLRGRLIILAAGALHSPLLLRRSGLGSDLVGRNLMRHFVDLYPIEATSAEAPDNRFKELAFNDFYRVDGVRLGSVQSFGRLPPPEVILKSVPKWLRGLASLGRPFLRRLVDRSITLATIAEDLPYLDNRVWAGPDGAVHLSYRLRGQDRARIAKLRGLMKRTLKGRSWRLLKQAENNERLAHVCGTCRFGRDPKTSVLDPMNRVHDVDNLYVVDSSFFPSSGGTNPSLTIAANALRVAEHLK